MLIPSKSKLKTWLRQNGFKPQNRTTWQDVLSGGGQLSRGGRLHRFRTNQHELDKNFPPGWSVDVSCPVDDFCRWAISTDLHALTMDEWMAVKDWADVDAVNAWVAKIKSQQVDAFEDKYIDAANDLHSAQGGLGNYANELDAFLEARDALKAHPDFPGFLPETYFSGGELDPVGPDMRYECSQVDTVEVEG